MSKASHSPHHAEILSLIREEHDNVFGPDPFSALKSLSSATADATTESSSSTEALLTTKLPYSTAFLKETLRLHPPAATIRTVPWSSTSLSVSLPLPLPQSSSPSSTPAQISITGLQLYLAPYLIHRNPHIWGPSAHTFNPARWLDEAYIAALPPGAYRPFERGPRNCIGRELALMEGMIVLVGVEFENVGLSRRVRVDGREREREVWSEHKVISVPVDGMVMKVRIREGMREG